LAFYFASCVAQPLSVDADVTLRRDTKNEELDEHTTMLRDVSVGVSGGKEGAGQVRIREASGPAIRWLNFNILLQTIPNTI
jgi:hypothetical protein